MPENRDTEKLPLGKREERRKSSSFQSKVKSPFQSANWFSQQDANWMQDPRGESPFQKKNKENPPLRRDTEGRQGSGSRGKENTPLHTANCESS